MAAPQASWYEDPWRQAAQRWWDGSAWTGYVAAPGSLLECDSINIAFDLMARTCRILDNQGAVVGSLDMSSGVSVPGQGSSATPQASELMIATPGDDPSFAAPASMAQMGPLATPQPVPLRDVEGHSLFILRAGPMGQSRKDFNVRVHGPDDTEMGRYQTGARGAKSVELHCGEQLVATVARDGSRGARQQIAVCGTDGAPLVTLRMGDGGAVQATVNVTVTVVGHVSGPVRHLAVILPLAFIALAAAAIPAMPLMPPRVPGSGASMPGVADMGGRIMGAVIGRMFESLGGD